MNEQAAFAQTPDGRAAPVPVGRPFFIKRTTDYFERRKSAGQNLVRRTVDSSLVQYFQIVQNGGGRLPDGDDTAAPVSTFHGGSYGV